MASLQDWMYMPPLNASALEDAVVLDKEATKRNQWRNLTGITPESEARMKAIAEQYQAKQNEATQATQQKQQTDTKPSSKKEDPFLEGFDDPYGEKEKQRKEQERKERLAKIRENADKRTWVDGKVVEEPAKTDPFLEGFNDPNGETKSSGEVAKDIAKFVVHAGKWGTNPFEGTAYEYRDRNKIQNETNLPVRAYQRQGARTAEPLGSLGIAAKNTPELAKTNGKDTVNYIFGLDTKYIDENGKLQNLSVPQWNFNRDLIKENNRPVIDDIAEMLTSKLPEKQGAAVLEAAEKMKVRNAALADKAVVKVETWLNGVDEASEQAKVNRQIAKVADKIPRWVDSGALKKTGKAFSAAGDIMNVIDLGYTLVQDHNDDGVIGYETVKKAVGIAGDAAGSAVGAKVGVWVGAALGGAISGGALSAPLAALGGFVGGVIGGMIGQKIGEKIVEDNKQYVHE